ncbi:hypothetical protein [Yeguia hominis]|uniref:THIF-type NAD/FAD binding fold domain-containing protein n=1 Tax=Yeguia hominis TaxID=2763662 RepID=A0A926DAC4_9FIRM|nr:hypothetical protein [Yeguia hominis]MBC8534176.1 hypothetical protein [Yeguia hominis]
MDPIRYRASDDFPIVHILSEENILRWAFAAFGIGMNKSKLLEIQLGMLHPEIYVEGISSNIDSNTLSKEAKEADLIVFTIGSSDQQLLFNRTLHNEKCNVPVLYAWLEAGGKYSHILAVDYGRRGCYECLFTDNEGQLVNNRALLNTNDIQDNLIIRNGCGGTRASYGTTVLLRTTAALLDTIHKVLDGSITENTLMLIEIIAGEDFLKKRQVAITLIILMEWFHVICETILERSLMILCLTNLTQKVAC